MIPPTPHGADARSHGQNDEIRNELREFLAQAAVSLVLERTGPSKPERRPPAPPSISSRRRWTHLPSRSRSFLALLLVAASAIAMVRWWPEPVQLPEALQGRWTTTAPAFTGRELIVEPRSLGFRAGPGEPEQVFPVAARRIEERGDARNFRIEYDAPEGRFTLILSLSPDGVRLANRSEVLWIRGTPSITP